MSGKSISSMTPIFTPMTSSQNNRGVMMDSHAINGSGYGCCDASVQHAVGLARAESMDLSNDPRFFGDNVINKRLAAFSTLGVISGLMTGTASWVMPNFLKTNMTFIGVTDPWVLFKHGIQLLGLMLIGFCFFLSMISTMVFGTQQYFTFRLMTSGPLGFESAKSFYLDPEMTGFRKQAANGLLWGLPAFLLGEGCELYMKDQMGVDEDDVKPQALPHRMGGFVILACFIFMSCYIWRIGRRHQQIFNMRYYQDHHAGAKYLMESLMPDSERNMRTGLFS